tara:strand:- start:68 stop:268 length:201 start_codon:yes stop_codon:yes gene_type:complete
MKNDQWPFLRNNASRYPNMIPCHNARDQDNNTRFEYIPFFGKSLRMKERSQYSGAAAINKTSLVSE